MHQKLGVDTATHLFWFNLFTPSLPQQTLNGATQSLLPFAHLQLRPAHGSSLCPCRLQTGLGHSSWRPRTVAAAITGHCGKQHSTGARSFQTGRSLRTVSSYPLLAPMDHGGVCRAPSDIRLLRDLECIIASISRAQAGYPARTSGSGYKLSSYADMTGNSSSSLSPSSVCKRARQAFITSSRSSFETYGMCQPTNGLRTPRPT